MTTHELVRLVNTLNPQELVEFPLSREFRVSEGHRTSGHPALISPTQTVAIIWLAGSSAADLIIASVLVWYL